MYASIRTYETDPANVPEVVRRAEEGFLPIISKSPGFSAYYAIAGRGGQLATVTIFDNEIGAEASVKEAAGWVKDNLAALLPNPPLVMNGEVAFSRTK